jgi:hypothetical protein
MTSNGLIPEHRTDKNGRNVLRHVRAQHESSESTVLAAAAPSITTPVPYEAFSDSFRKFWDRQDISETHYSDEDFDQRAVKVLNRIFSPDSEHPQPFAMMTALARGFNEMMGAGEEESGRTSIHNIAAFADDIHDLSDIRMGIDGLHKTVGIEKDYLLDADDDERTVAVAIMRTAEAISERADNWSDYALKLSPGKYVHSLAISDKRLLDLVVEYAPRIDELLELIEDGAPMLEADTLREMLNHEQKALAKGAL